MSILHELRTAKDFDLKKLYEDLGNRVPNLCIEERGNDIYYFYCHGTSTQGVDLSKEEYGYEIRNTILSSKADFVLSNHIAELVQQYTQCEIWSEEDEHITSHPVFSESDIEYNRKQEADTITVLLKDGQRYSFYGPVRQFHLGQNMLHYIENNSNDKLSVANTVEQIALKVQYKYPDYGTNDVLETERENGEKVTIKVLNSKSNYVTSYYDYIVLAHEQEEEEGLLMLTHATLMDILPTEWELLDEYSLHIPQIGQEAWNKLVEKAKPLNCFDEFRKEK